MHGHVLVVSKNEGHQGQDRSDFCMLELLAVGPAMFIRTKLGYCNYDFLPVLLHFGVFNILQCTLSAMKTTDSKFK